MKEWIEVPCCEQRPLRKVGVWPVRVTRNGEGAPWRNVPIPLLDEYTNVPYKRRVPGSGLSYDNNYYTGRLMFARAAARSPLPPDKRGW